MSTKNPSETLPPATPNRRADDRHPLTMRLMWMVLEYIQDRAIFAADLLLAFLDWMLVMILVLAGIALIVLSSYVLIMLFKG